MSDIYYVGFSIFAGICLLLSFFFQKKHSESRNVYDPNVIMYTSFRTNYLVVYTLVMGSDWLQGPYIYDLYRSYGYELSDIALLFIAGFLSSAVFGTMAGTIADKYGRKLMALFFCFIYIISCLTKLSPSFSVLMFGRITGGIATSLLFCVFEAWMVSEHNSRGFSEELLSETFSFSTFYNGLAAIISGIIANVLAPVFGPVAPFLASIVLLVVAAVIISRSWTENYGIEVIPAGSLSKFLDGLNTVATHPNILFVGLIQCLFESAMYSFVFLWSPVLDKTKAQDGIDSLPYGVIFSSFMVSIMIGSILFRKSLDLKTSYTTITEMILVTSVFALAVPCYFKASGILFFAFNVFEICCGVYFPTIGMLRGKYVPEETRATIMSIFRIPLNLIVVFALLRVHDTRTEVSFFVCTILVALSYFCSIRLSHTPIAEEEHEIDE